MPTEVKVDYWSRGDKRFKLLLSGDTSDSNFRIYPRKAKWDVVLEETTIDLIHELYHVINPYNIKKRRTGTMWDNDENRDRKTT